MEVSFDFTGKRYVVTGASSGIGRYIAKELAFSGADVLAIARRKTALEELQAKHPARITIVSADVTDYQKIEESIDEFVQRKGKLHGSVHAAGMLVFTPLRAFDERQAKKMMDISFWAGMHLLQVVTKKKNADGLTSHVHFSSASAHKGQRGLGVYGATKAAIQSGIRSASRELAERGHRVNTVSPGIVNTDMTKDMLKDTDVITKHLLGLGVPEDVSGMVLFLLSDRAKWITGTDIIVDGGFLA